FAVSDGRGLCPQAWHVPTDAEWQTLESALGMPTNELGQTGYRGGAENVGGKLKATVLWNSPNTGATNESGFSAVPGGFLNIGIDNLFHFYFQGDRGGWWSSTNNPAFAKYRELMSAHAGILRSDLPRSYGTCVRCLRDATVGLFEQDPVQFTIAPNPTTSVFTLKLSQPAQAGQVVVLDATGRAVLAQRFNGNGPVTLDLSGHGNGLYVVQVFYPDGTRLTERVVKQ
ncbi:MAG TPA: FISUMP domain-containing protein, partial [Flavobacteriales bacterium]|nr:FISUMP domain-containing protein [Flavobacteriales bacterium]